MESMTLNNQLLYGFVVLAIFIGILLGCSLCMACESIDGEPGGECANDLRAKLFKSQHIVMAAVLAAIGIVATLFFGGAFSFIGGLYEQIF